MSNVLVTGSSRGIGKAIASRFIHAGHDVFIHGTRLGSPRRLNEFDGDMPELATHLKAAGFVIGDLTIRNIIPEEIASSIDVLVNCAGGDIGYNGVEAPNAGRPLNNDPLRISLQDTNTLIANNFLTTVLTCQQIAPHMKDRQSGSIVNIGSMNVKLHLAEGAIYSAMKAAIHHYTTTLAEYLRDYNVRVNCVAPGSTLTPRFEASREVDWELVDSRDLLRYGRPSEIAEAVYQLSMLSYCTGATLYVDGGLR